jgi:hypothetical protein
MPDCSNHRTARRLTSVMRTPVALPPSARIMKDYRATIEKLRTDAAEARLIREVCSNSLI